jgi:hypothetical protein
MERAFPFNIPMTTDRLEWAACFQEGFIVRWSNGVQCTYDRCGNLSSWSNGYELSIPND